jgi:hypothetical protein
VFVGYHEQIQFATAADGPMNDVPVKALPPPPPYNLLKRPRTEQQPIVPFTHITKIQCSSIIVHLAIIFVPVPEEFSFIMKPSCTLYKQEHLEY